MAIFRKVKKNDYTVIDNNIFRNQRLTLKAKGMICTMLSLPDDWEFSEDGLSSLSNDGKSSIRSTLKELMEYGYLVRTRNRDSKGVLRDYVYTIFEEPTFENQKQVEPTCDYPTLENRNTYKILNNIKETNNINIISKESLKKPTLEEVQEYCRERNNNVNAKQFFDYYEVNDWVDNKENKVKNWKQKLITWEKHSFTKEPETPSWFNEDLNIVNNDTNEMEELLKEMTR